MKLKTFLLTLLLITVFCGCAMQGGADKSTPTPEPTPAETQTPTPTSTPTPSPSPTPINPAVIPEGADANIVYEIDTSKQGKTITNKVSTMNMWMFQQYWLDEAKDQPETYFSERMPFVESIQFMQATGGNDTRDLFKNPSDKNVLDDYYFDGLIEACRNVIKQGVKPCIKTGNVPQKFSTVNTKGPFDVNLYGPDDYNVYYNYIKAIAQALVDEFGLEEVLTWSWGCYTECENHEWLNVDDKPEETFVVFCKIYDYTVAALQDVLGEEIDIGVHCTTYAENTRYWDELAFVEHCAKGTNYATGKTGTRITYLAASYYDYNANSVADDGIVRTINILRNKAEEVGLTGLRYGIDEGRVMVGTTSGHSSNALISRVVGRTYQGAYDARLIKQMVDNDIDYFAAWAYTSNVFWGGIDTVSLHVAREFYKMVGSKEVAAEKIGSEASGGEVGVTASYDEATGKTYIMAYNFGDNIDFNGWEKLMFNVKLPEGVTKVKVTRSLVDDDANFFDDFEKLREEQDIEDRYFSWSPESADVDKNLTDALSKAIYQALSDKFEKAAQLVPTEGEAEVKNGSIALYLNASPQVTAFYVIEPIK